MNRRVARRRVLAALAWPWAAARAQSPAGSLRRVGVLAPSTPEREAVTLKPFFEQMERLGWVPGRTVAYDHAYASDQYGELPHLARELVARGPDLIFAPPLPAAVAAHAATRSIPIVFASGTDPVGAGLVESLARPGGNATGMISVVDSLAPKSLEILLKILPGVKRLGLLGDPGDPRLRLDRDALAPLLAARGIHLSVGEASHPQAFDAAIAGLVRERVEVIMTNSSLSFNLRERLFEQLRGQRIVVVGHRKELVAAGALMSYAPALQEQIRRAAMVVDKVLRGARPAEIPVEQPTRFELTLNGRTARALGIPIPRNVLLGADEVIE